MNKDLCPCCRGIRGRWQHFPSDEDWIEIEHIESSDCDCCPRFDPCSACHGTGELTGIARATLLARGDIAPVQKRGFA